VAVEEDVGSLSSNPNLWLLKRMLDHLVRMYQESQQSFNIIIYLEMSALRRRDADRYNKH
jgi:hypothetical protein